MGLIGRALASGALTRAGEAAEDLTEIFVPNATRAMELSHASVARAQELAEAEFRHAGATRFDRAVNGLNRLPRPAMALGTLALFVYAMTDPSGFSVRMEGLALVPEPLWWLLGAIIGFYFGARELHHARSGAAAGIGRGLTARLARRSRTASEENAALDEWRARMGHFP